MPFITIKTNAKNRDDRIPERAAVLAAELLGKPLKVIAVSVEYNENMAFDGVKDKIGAWIEIAAIGFGNKAEIAAKMTDFAEKNFGAERDLVCLRLIDLVKPDVAHGGKLLG